MTTLHPRPIRTRGRAANAAARVATTLALLAALLPGAAFVAHAQGGDATPRVEARDTAYRDAERGFEVTVPAGWSRSQAGEALALTGPDGKLSAWLVSVPAGDAEAGVAAAWRLAEPDFALEASSVVRPPASGGIEQAVQIVYKTDEDRVALAVGYLFQGRVYAVLVNGAVDAFARRQAQVSVIVSSFDILARPRTDLASRPAAPFGEAARAALDAFVPAAMADAGVPGAVVEVVQDGQVVYQRAFGVKRAGGDARMDLGTQLMIGSSTKSLTTLMMATLVDDGVMRWDTPAAAILPSFRVADARLSRTISMQNLVCACSGVPRRDLEFILNADTLGAGDVVRSLAGFQFFTDFGETFQYSNQMVAAAGYIAGVAAGGDPGALLPGYAAALQARVLTPIGMRDTTLSMRQVEARGDYAIPHGQALTGARAPIPLSEEALLTPVAPAATLWSTAPDMGRYLLTLLAGGVTPDGRRVVSTANLQHLWQPQVKISADTSYGLGWMVGRYKGLTLLEHAGNTFGFTSGMAILPDKGIGTVVLTNARASNVFNEAVIRRVNDLLFGQDTAAADEDFHFALKTASDAIARNVARLQAHIAPEAVAPYLGAYRNPALGDLTLSFEDGRLFADFGEVRTELRANVTEAGTVTYQFADPPLAGFALTLEKGSGGQPEVVLPSPPDRYVFSPAPAVRW